ncbi:izumo sperm-egg fusion protein 1 [Myripristis murdjan]|uniref:izumo sperm-egg fusion protein 1 n=1 Tax=Myripristis murdjan TaxID=586833 RepID=UPI001176442A|nr:izumo sperm-egg fusion protein 1 [Myripristis murdjan]
MQITMKLSAHKGPRSVLLTLVALLCCIPAGKFCLQCDRTIRLLHEDFILSAASVADQIELKKIRDHAHVTYQETSRERSGVIDPTTLYRASTEYQSEFDRFQSAPHTESVTFDAIQIMEKGRKILEKHLDTFIHGGLCPNKCGLLYQRVMDCFSCRYKLHTCSSQQHDCGVHLVQAEEGAQAVLDCFLPWHTLVLGRPEYHYSWAPGLPGAKTLVESDFKVLVVTEDSSVVLNQLHVDEKGTYRCTLQDRKGTVFSQLTFLLNVTSVPAETRRPLLTLPSLPHGVDSPPFQRPKNLLLLIIATITALGLVASVWLTVILGLMIKQLRDEELRTATKHNESAV